MEKKSDTPFPPRAERNTISAVNLIDFGHNLIRAYDTIFIGEDGDYLFRAFKVEGDQESWQHDSMNVDRLLMILEGRMTLQLQSEGREGGVALSCGEICLIPGSVYYKLSADRESIGLLIQKRN